MVTANAATIFRGSIRRSYNFPLIYEWLPHFIPVRFGIVTMIRDGCSKNRVCVLDTSKNFSLYQSAQNGPVFHTACYSKGTWKNFQRVNRPVREDDHSNPSNAKATL